MHICEPFQLTSGAPPTHIKGPTYNHEWAIPVYLRETYYNEVNQENLSSTPKTHLPTHLSYPSLFKSEALHTHLKVPYIHTLGMLPQHVFEQHLNNKEIPLHTSQRILLRDSREMLIQTSECLC